MAEMAERKEYISYVEICPQTAFLKCVKAYMYKLYEKYNMCVCEKTNLPTYVVKYDKTTL